MKTVSLTNLENLIMDQSDSFVEEHDNAPNLKLIKKALQGVIQNELTEKQRTILLLYYSKQYNMVEIAKMFDINKSSVSRSIRSSINKLTRFLQYYDTR